MTTEQKKIMEKHLAKIGENYKNSISFITKKRKILFETCKELSNNGNFSIDDINKNVEKKHRIENFCNNNQPQDYCYNSVNVGCYTPKFLLKKDKSLFEFKDIDWKPNKMIKVTWKPIDEPKIDVGTYSYNGFDWSPFHLIN